MDIERDLDLFFVVCGFDNFLEINFAIVLNVQYILDVTKSGKKFFCLIFKKIRIVETRFDIIMRTILL